MSAKTRLIFEGDNRTARTFRAIDSSFSRLQGKMRGITRLTAGLGRSLKSAAGAAGLLAAGAGIAKLGSDVVRFNDVVAKLSRALGEPVEQVSALQFAFDLAGASATATQKILQRIKTSSQEVANGTKEYVDAFAQLRLDAEGFARLDLIGQVGVLSEALVRAADEERLYLAEAVVGRRNAVDFLNLAANGAEGLARALRDAQISGAVITPEQAQQAENLIDSLARLNAGTRKLAAEGVGALGGLAGETATATEDVNELTQAIKRATEEVTTLSTVDPFANLDPEVSRRNVDEAIRFAIEGAEEDGAFSPLENAFGNAVQAGATQGSEGVKGVFNRLWVDMAADLANSAFLQLLKNILPAAGTPGIGGAVASFLGFDAGTRSVPGPTGAPRLAVVHGGEAILPSSGAVKTGAGNVFNIDARGAAPGSAAAIKSAVEQAVALSERRTIELQKRERMRR